MMRRLLTFSQLLLIGIAVYTLLYPTNTQAGKIMPLSNMPDWSQLDRYASTITRDEFINVLEKVYSDPASYAPYLFIGEEQLEVRKQSEGQEVYSLPFAKEKKEGAPSPRYWKSKAELFNKPPEQNTTATQGAQNNEAAPKPLQGIRIVLDPGHLGGSWAKMEERWFQVGEDQAIQEGDLTLFIAQQLKTRLETLGAEVSNLRESTEPLTEQRPHNFLNDARLFLRDRGVLSPPKTYENSAEEERIFSVQWQSEKFFYRTAEIRERARRVNQEIQPDLVLCLHFNAEGWGDPANPAYVANNHLHLLINGSYDIGELSYDDLRFEMLQRLLQGIHHEELALAEVMAKSMAENTELPPYVYPGTNAKRVNDNPYIFARNLLANRLYTCPVIYFEPYVMNNKEVYQRLVAGDFAGKTRITTIAEDGSSSSKLHRSIYQDYIEGVVSGLVNYYSAP